MGLLAGREAPDWLDRVLRLVTHAGGTAATIGACTLLLKSPETRRLGMVTSLATILSHLAVQALKRVVVRRRPTVACPGLTPLADLPDHYSFPSGHSCAAMAMALSVGLAVPIASAPLLLLALAVGVSRVYLRVHYVTDVLAGQAIGAGAALLAHRIVS